MLIISNDVKETNECTRTITDEILKMTDVNVKKMFIFKRIIIETNVGILSRFLSGHSNLNYYQNRMQLSYDTGCDY